MPFDCFALIGVYGCWVGVLVCYCSFVYWCCVCGCLWLIRLHGLAVMLLVCGAAVFTGWVGCCYFVYVYLLRCLC